MNRWKAVPWVLVGVALLAVSLVAARLNSPTPSAAGDHASTSPSGSGPTVLGTVDTADGILPLNAPGVIGMPALTVKKVFVKHGATVSPGDLLIEFDPSAVQDKKKQAEDAVIAAQWVEFQASTKVKTHAGVVEKAKLGVRKAEADLALTEKAQKAVSDTLEENLSIATQSATDRTPLTDAQKEVRRSRNTELLQANALVSQAKFAVEAAKLDLKQAEDAAPLLDADVRVANAKAAAAKEQVAEASSVIESFKLKAQVAGTVEQITVADGMAVGQANRTPLMYLIPSGPRVVRAEVEAEFAHKIDDFIGKTVTIRAGQNFADTYTGTARRVSGAFLPKRFGADSLVSNPTRALECVIDITDPALASKPPLRPGQPVRVTFGQ